PPRSASLSPYTTLFRSGGLGDPLVDQQLLRAHLHVPGPALPGLRDDGPRRQGLVGGGGVRAGEREARAERRRAGAAQERTAERADRKSTRLNSSHVKIS